MIDPRYLAALRLPDVAPPNVLGVDGDGSVVTTRVAYEYTGSLDPIAQRVLRGSEIGWVQEVTLDRDAHRARFTVVPKVHADRLRCSGTYTLRELAETTTRTWSRARPAGGASPKLKGRVFATTSAAAFAPSAASSVV